MDKVLNESLTRYFKVLSKLGYMSYSEVDKLLVLIFIYDLLESDCKSFITEGEYRIIDNALYCLYGSTCLIPYPEYLTMNNLNLGSISELAYMMKKNKEDISKVIDNVNEIKKTQVIKGDLNGEEIPNIDISKSIK